jgi:hypothetical protein
MINTTDTTKLVSRWKTEIPIEVRSIIRLRELLRLFRTRKASYVDVGMMTQVCCHSPGLVTVWVRLEAPGTFRYLAIVFFWKNRHLPDPCPFSAESHVTSRIESLCLWNVDDYLSRPWNWYIEWSRLYTLESDQNDILMNATSLFLAVWCLHSMREWKMGCTSRLVKTSIWNTSQIHGMTELDGQEKTKRNRSI